MECVGCARTDDWLVEGIQDSGDVTAQLGVLFGGQDAIDVRPGLFGWRRLGPVFVFQAELGGALEGETVLGQDQVLGVEATLNSELDLFDRGADGNG